MFEDPIIPGPEHAMTREHLSRGTLLQALRSNPPLGLTVRTDAELEWTLRAVLDRHDPTRDLHVFGYGSLMWNPALDVVSTRVARVNGWHRSFCLRLISGRGTLERPGAMLAFDRGGACNGVLHRIEATKVDAELHLLWRREMLSDSYDPRWISVSSDGQKISALTFVANRAHERYLGCCSPAEVSHLIRTGRGPLGTSRAYSDATVETLERLGFRDRGIERIRRAVHYSESGSGDA